MEEKIQCKHMNMAKKQSTWSQMMKHGCGKKLEELTLISSSISVKLGINQKVWSRGKVREKASRKEKGLEKYYVIARE